MSSAIRTERLAKRYRIGSDRPAYSTLRESIVRTFRRPFDRSTVAPDAEYAWALRGLDIELDVGEVLGIIGCNGAGKSTLLKLISRITEPTRGRIYLRGRVGSLLEVGASLHPELTGRENIFLYGAVVGMSRREIRRKFDEIVSFAEIDRYIDTPIKRYSSGMHVRLAFSVVAHLEAEILLVDEVLAVGDAAFQRKCISKIHNVRDEGRTIVFVSHNMAAIRNLCSSVLLLDRGRNAFCGPVAEGITLHTRLSATAALHTDLSALPRRGARGVRLHELALLNDGRRVEHHKCGAPIQLACRYEIQRDLGIRDLSLQLRFDRPDGETVCTFWNKLLPETRVQYPQAGWLVYSADHFGLRPGVYRLSIWVKSHRGVEDWLDHAIEFQVLEGDFYGTGAMPPADTGSVLVDHAFSVAPLDALGSASQAPVAATT